MRPPRVLLLSLLTAPMFWSAVHAEPVADGESSSWVDKWLQGPGMTGNWFGTRTSLTALGVRPSITYVTDLQANVLGGLRKASAYAGQLNVDLRFDMEKLAGLPGLSLDMSGNWASGSDLSNSIGNVFDVAQAFDGTEVRLYTLFLRQALFEGRLDVKAGRFATGDDFLVGPSFVGLVNEALNPRMTVVQINVPGVTTGPNATWGGRVVARPTEALSVTAGAFYSDPSLDQLTTNGTEFAIDAGNGYFAIGEATYHLNHGKGATGLPGHYRIGGYYDSNRFASFTDPASQRRGNYGFYLTGEQMVFRELGAVSVQGLSVYGSVIYAPQERINAIPYFAEVALGYQGLLPGRDSDVAAMALYYGGFSRYLPGQTYELTLEWTYALVVAPWLTIQPDIQYIVHPSGKSSVSNALVVGVQLSLQF
ncbi:MAG TPA: carbohydrate porin [Gemmatimonadales bacterium]|nr:carbohydrate porin [Gemmatimonadales bacterium]